MDNFTFYTPTRYIFGRGVESQAGSLIAQMGCHNVLLVSGGQSARRSGLLDRVERCLKEAGLNYANLEGVQPNPTDDRVYDGIELCHQNNIDMILAVGGGSAIDTAKAVAVGALYHGDFWDFFEGKPITVALPVAVVLTIPAAGSEGSGHSVITRRSDHKKVSIGSDMLRPRFSLMDPELTFTLPPYQTASGIADMMAHIMERYFTTTNEVETTDRISEGLLKAIIAEAPRVIEQPDNYDARANIMWAGTLAHNGLCGCGRREEWSAHGLEHELSAFYGVTHGAGLAVTFPAWMAMAAKKRPAKIAQFGRRVFDIQLDSDRACATEAIRRLREFFHFIGLPTTLAELGIEEPDFRLLTDHFHLVKGNPTGNYLVLTPELTEELYRSMQ